MVYARANTKTTLWRIRSIAYFPVSISPPLPLLKHDLTKTLNMPHVRCTNRFTSVSQREVCVCVCVCVIEIFKHVDFIDSHVIFLGVILLSGNLLTPWQFIVLYLRTYSTVEILTRFVFFVTVAGPPDSADDIAARNKDDSVFMDVNEGASGSHDSDQNTSKYHSRLHRETILYKYTQQYILICWLIYCLILRTDWYTVWYTDWYTVWCSDKH